MKNQYSSVKKTECSQNSLQLFAPPYGAMYAMLWNPDTSFLPYSHIERLIQFWPRPQQNAFGQSIEDKKKMYYVELIRSILDGKKGTSCNRRRAAGAIFFVQNHSAVQLRYGKPRKKCILHFMSK